MKSKSQVPISQELVRKIVNHHFPTDTKMGNIEELSDGWSSVAYSVELPEESFDIIIKLGIPEEIPLQIYEHKLIETEVGAIELVKNHPISSKIPLPEILGSDLDGSIVGRSYVITKKFLGNPLEKIQRKLEKNELAEIETQIGEMQSNLNTINGEKFGYFFDHPEHSVSSGSWATTFTLMFENLFKDALNYETQLPFDPDEIRTVLKNAKEALDEVKTPSFTHWDLWVGNIFVKKSNSGKWQLEGIIDFERAIFGDPLTESSLRGKKKKPNLIKGYGKDLFATKTSQIRDKLYDLYLATTLLIEMYPRKYGVIWRILYRMYAKSLYKPALSFLRKETL